MGGWGRCGCEVGGWGRCGCVYVYVYVFVYEGIVCVSVISVRACVRLVERIKVVCVCVGM